MLFPLFHERRYSILSRFRTVGRVLIHTERRRLGARHVAINVEQRQGGKRVFAYERVLRELAAFCIAFVHHFGGPLPAAPAQNPGNIFPAINYHRAIAHLV